MSIQKYMLHNFIVIVPSCVQTTRISSVLEIFSQGQCDRLVVVNKQQCPIGVLNLRRLMPQLIGSSGYKASEYVQQPLWAVAQALVEPIATLPAELGVEQFGLYLRSQKSQTNTGSDWALVDRTGKLLGILDTARLLQFLALSPPAGMSTGVSKRDRALAHVLDSMIHLLEQLPWPLMLQNGNGEVLTQNTAWCQQFGAFSDPEAVRREMEALVKEGESACSSSRCQIGTQADTCICVFTVQNGQERVWQFVKIPLSESVFNTDLWLLLATDVTEQQQLASELVAKNADLIQLNRLKDEFLSCISHELKTPITAVLGLSTLLKDQALGQLNERQARYAGLIHQSGRHLMLVVNDILDLTRMETGQLKLRLEPVQIRTVCDRAVEQARAIQSKTSQPSASGESLTESAPGHRFTLLIEPGLDNLVADELRLRQMLVHLLSNAFKFTEAGGEIGLRVSRWEGWIAFTVWDTGIGIPEQKQHLIFQKFQQLENPLTRQFDGTGLGLVLTRALARLHGGDVSFLSKEGKGSQFTLLLPPSPPHKRAGGADRNRLVLVVEAAPRFIEDLTEHLTDLGYRFVIARSGTEALEKARRLQPRAVFLNPLLPLLSGWDVLTLLKSDAATRQIPAIVTATLAEKEQAFSKRADEFLSLPVQQDALQQILTRFCAIPSVSQSEEGVSQSAGTDTPLTILRLVGEHGSVPVLDSGSWLLNSGLLHQHHYRVLEADALEQAELLARIWQPDVVLLDAAIPNPLAYLKQLSQYPSLAALPLVTLDAAIAQAANQVTGLSVFPCLTPFEKLGTDTLLPVLQTATGRSLKPSLLVVDISTLPDLQQVSVEQVRSEWFQALIQYLQTAGFRGIIAHSWAEVLQQIRQQSADLLLICLGELKLHPGVLAALMSLNQQHALPPVLVLDRRLSQNEDATESLETILGGIATQILPPSLSIKELLDHIYQTLARPNTQSVVPSP